MITTFNEELPMQMTMENAHRAKMIHRKDKPESKPVPFFFVITTSVRIITGTILR